MILRPAVLPLLACCVLLSACGGGDKGGTTTTAGPGTTIATTANTADPSLIAKDRSYAQQIVLAASDLPAGWTAKAPKAPSVAANNAADLMNGCFGLPKNSEIRVMKYDGNVFENTGNSVSSDVASLKSAEIAQQYRQGLMNPQNFRCIASVIDAQLSLQLGDGRSSSTVARLNGVTTSDSQYALRITTLVTANRQTTTVYSDILGIHHGRYQTSVNVTYFGSPAPVEFDKSLLGAAARRMAAIR